MEIFIITCVAIGLVLFVTSLGIHSANINKYGIGKMKNEILGHRCFESMFVFCSLALASFAIYEETPFGKLFCFIYLVIIAALHIVISRRVWDLKRSIIRRRRNAFMYPEYLQ